MSTVTISKLKPELYKLKMGKYNGQCLKNVPVEYLHALLEKNDKLYEKVRKIIQDYLKDAKPSTPKARGGEFILNFGKHKNKMIKEVPDDYLEWLLNNNGVFQAVKNHIKEFKSI